MKTEIERIKEEIENTNCSMFFEIEVEQYENEQENEYKIYYISFDTQFNTLGDENKLFLGHITNTGFWPYHNLFVEIDQDRNLDYYLQGLYEIALEHSMLH